MNAVSLVGYVVMPIIKNERSYLINIPMGAPFEEVREALNDALKNVDIMESNAKEADEKRAQEAQNEVEADSSRHSEATAEVVGSDGL